MNKHLVDPSTPISLKERISYIIGCSGFPFAVLLFQAVLMFYFTDVLGISAASAGVLLLITRIWDGVNDPLMGILLDRTQTRYGKCRHYILVGGIGLAIFTVLLFTNPGLESHGAKLAWAYFTYIGFDMTYTCFAVSQKVLPTRLTQERSEITRLASNCFIGTSVVSIIAAAIFMDMITGFSGAENNMARGYSLTAVVAAALLVVTTLFLVSIKERDFPVESSKSEGTKKNLLKEIVNLFRNKPFMGFCIASTFAYMGYYLSAGTSMYYCIYNLKNADLYSPLTVIDYGAPIVAALTLPYLTKLFGKRKVIIAAFLGIAVGYGLRYLSGDKTVPLMLIFATIGGIGIGYWNVLFTPVSLDCAIYGEYTTGVRSDALYVSSFTLITKAASGLGGALLGFLLESCGYVENAAEQSAEVLNMLQICTTLATAVLALCSLAAFILLYRVKDSELERMNRELRGLDVAKA